MFHGRRWLVLCAAAFAAVPSAVAARATVQELTLAAQGHETSLIVTLSDVSAYRSFTLSAPERLVLDITSARLGRSALPLPAGAGAIQQIRAANRPDGTVRLVIDLSAQAQPQGIMRQAAGKGANQIVVKLLTAPAPALAASAAIAPTPTAESRSAGEPPAVSVAGPPVLQGEPEREPVGAAPPTAKAEPQPIGRDIIIAVDAGHGGKDPGAHGPRGVLEKDVTLRIARRLVDIINAEPGMRGVLTRNRDEFIPLRGRMERARSARADLFVSVHADAVRNRRVQGASVYVLNEKGATDEASRRLAARENAADLIGGVSLASRDRTLASVLLDLSQNAALSSSIDVADRILDEMARVGTVRKRQVMQAPFMVLKSPDVPSVLIETAYISNPEEERRLNSQSYRSKLAGAIFAGVRGYFYTNPPHDSLVAQLGARRMATVTQHVIRSGETLSLIASRYNISVQRIRDVNRLKSDQIAAGRVLRIPQTRET